MWKFREMIRAEENVDPIQGEFFASQEIGDIGDVLTREVIQNSLDAREKNDSTSVRLKITYGMSEKTFGELCGPDSVFYGLKEHLTAKSNGLQANKVPDYSEKLEYLTVEDFGTRGLNGDPFFDDTKVPMENAKQNDFFYFWRNIGRSHKQKGELGSWGLGKHVFPAASRINAYFGHTIRSEDYKELLMGKSILKIHHVNRKKYAPYGYFGFFQDSDFYAAPFEQSEIVKEFRKLFNIKRETEPGLSVVIPFPRIGLQGSPKGIIKAIVKEYFYPIIQRILSVEIKYPGCQSILVSDETIKKISNEYMQNDETLQRTIDLAQWSTSASEENCLQIKSPSLEEAPSWRNVHMSDCLINTINNSLEQNGKIATKVPVRVKRKNEEPIRGSFYVYFSQTEIAERSPAKYIRQGIYVKEANRSKMDAGCVSIVRIQDKELGDLLRCSEPPAHNKWEQRNNEELLDYYDNASSTITFVKNAPHEIWRIIMKTEMEKNRDVLRDIFHLDIGEIKKGKKQRTGNGKPKTELDEEIKLEDTNKKMIETNKLDGERTGFTIRPYKDANQTPQSLIIKAGYRPLTGSALKKYSPYDFRLDRSPITMELHGVEKDICKENFLKVIVLDEDFEIKVTGFDSKRDLVVSVKPEKGELDNDQEI